jgi:hypothetical protein
MIGGNGLSRVERVERVEFWEKLTVCMTPLSFFRQKA